MGIDNIQYQRRGQRLKANDFNSVVDRVKNMAQTTQTGRGTSTVNQTLFYTDVEIPAYSIFPIYRNDVATESTLHATYRVEQYNESHKDLYMSGYYGTNGRLDIAAGTAFYGYVIDIDWDAPIKISDYGDGSKECGFQNQSWAATTNASGIYINCQAPQASGCYYCRLKVEGEGGSAKVKFVKYNGATTEQGGTIHHFAPLNADGGLISADTDTFISAKIPPYLTIDQIEVGGIYRIEYIADYGGWFITDGQCSEYVSPYAPVRMSNILAYPNETISGNFDDTTTVTGISDTQVYATATYNRTLSTANESDLFSVAPTITAATFQQNFKTYWRYTFGGARLKNHAKGVACYDVYATDGSGAAYSAYRLSLKVQAKDFVPAFNQTIQTIDLYYGAEEQTITIGTATDEDGDELSIMNAAIADSGRAIANHELSIDSNGVVSLTVQPVGTDETEATTDIAIITFQIDDGYLDEADGNDAPYQYYTIRLNIQRREQ